MSAGPKTDRHYTPTELDPIRKRVLELGNMYAVSAEAGVHREAIPRLLRKQATRGKNTKKVEAYLTKLTEHPATNGTKPVKEGVTHGKRRAQETDNHLLFAYARTLGWLDAYAESIGVPSRDFARRVGEVLLSTEGGRLRGTGY